MVELAKSDAVIVTGGDHGFNRIFAQPEINSLADLRGKTVVVDAPTPPSRCCSSKARKDLARLSQHRALHAVNSPDRIGTAADGSNAKGTRGGDLSVPIFTAPATG